MATTSHTITGYTADTISDSDQLGQEREVHAIAALLTSRFVEPPLSLALLGTAASGKSFFLRRTTEQVERLAREASHDTHSASPFCRRIRQFWYNAWEYDGANQWLALADGILGAYEDATEAPLRSLGMPTERKLRTGLLSEVNKANAVLANTRQGKELAERDFEEANAERASHEAFDTWRETTRRLTTRLSSSDFGVQQINKAGDLLGLEELSNDAELLDQLFQQSKTLAGRATLLTSSLKTQRHFGNVFLGLVLLVLLSLLVLFLLSVAAVSSNAAELLEKTSKGIAGTGTVVAVGGLLWAGFARNRASDALHDLRPIEPLLREIVREVKREQAERVSLSEARLGIKRKQLDDALNRWAQASSALSVAEQQLADFDARGAVANVRDYYRKDILAAVDPLRPSIVPILRADLEALSARSQSSAISAMDPDNARIPERVIVYIEGLDNCKEETVVNVLQAAHLLLSFPLFAVVLAADSQWLIHCLETRAARAGDGVTAPPSSASIETLERLIQMQFWVEAPTTALQVQHVVRSLLIESPPRPPEAGPATIDATIGPATASPREASIAAAPPLTADPALTAAEVEFMMDVSIQMQSSPRRIRRLINSYRFLRAMLRQEELPQFVSDDTSHSDYRAVLTLLSAIILAPELAPHFYRSIQLDADDGAAMETWSPEQVESGTSAAYRIQELLRSYVGADPQAALKKLRRWSSLSFRFSLLRVN